MASLPSGYTKLDYIESSGTQYIDTGFIPNQDSAVHIVCQPTVASGWQGIFGARSATNVGEFGVDIPAGTTLRSVYGTGNVTTTVSTVATKLDIYKNKNVCTINGAVLTNSTETFSSGYPIWIFDKNTAGSKWNPCSMKLYSCKVYDNGTLVRDFIPCKNASGTLGLWDNVNSVFYVNAGTGVFIAGPEVPISGSGGGGKHKTLIAGTSYGIKSGRTLIGGTGYDIKKGRTLIGGTGYDIKFGVPVGELTVGTSVYMNVNGVRTEFIVVHQGNPDSKWYTAGGNGTWVLIKQVSKQLTADLPSDGWIIGDYQGCFLDTYANGEFLTSLDANIQSIIQQVTFKYICYNSSQNALKRETTRKIMFPDLSDLGISVSESLRKHGGLAYFKNSNNSKRIATNGSSNCPYFTCDFVRTGQNTYYWYYITDSGDIDRTQEGTNYARPLYVLPQDTLIDDNFNIMPA